MPSLDDLTGSLQDYVREFLSFRDILKTRRISIRWRDRDIDKIPKSAEIYIDRSILPPPVYLAKNLRKLDFWDCSDPVNFVYLRDLLYQNAHNLEELILTNVDAVPFQLPIFKKLERFTFGEWVGQNLLGHIVAKAKNLKNLFFDNEETTHLDYRHLASIESITCCENSYLIQITNIPPQNSLKKVIFECDGLSHEEIAVWRDNFPGIAIKGSFKLFSFTLTKDIIRIDSIIKPKHIWSIDLVVDGIRDLMHGINQRGQVRIEWGTKLTMLERCLILYLTGCPRGTGNYLHHMITHDALVCNRSA